MSNFEDSVHAWMETSGYSQTALAADAEIDPGHLSKMVHGERAVNIPKLWVMAECIALKMKADHPLHRKVFGKRIKRVTENIFELCHAVAEDAEFERWKSSRLTQVILRNPAVRVVDETASLVTV